MVGMFIGCPAEVVMRDAVVPGHSSTGVVLGGRPRDMGAMSSTDITSFTPSPSRARSFVRCGR